MVWVGLKVKVKATQSCATFCNSMDYTVLGILQARILEWVAISFSRGSSPTQGTNPGLLHCRQILYHLSHQGNLQIPMKLLQLAIMRTCYHPQVRGVSEQQAMNPGEGKKRRPAELDSAFTQWGTS